MDAQNAERLRTVFSDTVLLDTSMLSDRLHGAPAVGAFFDAFTELCETLTIQDEAEGSATSYLVWSGAAFNGRLFDGVTSLARDERGQIHHIRVLCEPFSMLLRFSAALTPRLQSYLPN
ncbi:hypothetical protein [Dyella sp. C11]|uniref:hypothetical protein n=1 Tax=Dyella sp. C11 TaxID=2126991 RepID=UPI0013003519|nr:hypothetical protein [Dyella sp. C11]